ncbi:VWA domain-containing protein [Cytobacillus firmus]|uniref:vWA domain-containing protein n=1 Tax=Cytobacillus firmus TaxID=1399 RepID=UPI00237B65B4|nr:VWA domain-containing protein [Cytobacillus firmus]MDD9312828.1 VWA domain-containing protein [Cytobacillus firmus]
MQFLNPAYFILSIFIGVFVLFYFFRKQYAEKTNSSNLLWEQVLNEWQASPWLKKLQQNLLFWLQLLALLLLMLALVRPFWLEDSLKGEHIIIIIDPSASMSAESGGKSRFEIAKEEMLDLAGKLNGQQVSLIKAGEKNEILLSREDDLNAIRRTIEGLELTYEHENMEKAVLLAGSLSSGGDAALHIFSDSAGKKDLMKELAGLYTVVHNIGENAGNVSLQSFGTAAAGDGISAAAVIENQYSGNIETAFTVKSEGKVLFEQNLSLKANEEKTVQIKNLPEKPYYEAAISISDGYSADNHAASIYTDPKPKVYTLGDVNPFAVKGFQTIGAELLQTDPSALKGLDMKGVVVAEGSTLSGLPELPMIFFNASKDKAKLEEAISGDEDSLFEYANFEKVYISSASSVLKGEWETVLKSGDIPLIQRGMHNGQPIIIVNFNLSDTDWPLLPGFPIFLYNSYQWLSQQSDFLGYFSSGEERWINIGNGTGSWEIFNNKDENLYSLDLNKETFKAPIIPGTYQAVSGNQIYYFSVLLDEREKSAGIEESFTLNAKSSEKSSMTQRPNESLWFWMAFIAFILIVIEWEVYRRGHRG